MATGAMTGIFTPTEGHFAATADIKLSSPIEPCLGHRDVREDVYTSRTLQALVDTIIPADEYPSGWQAGVGAVIHTILTADLKDRAPLVEAALDLLHRESQARHDGVAFADLPPSARDSLIADLLEGKTVLDWGVVPAQEFVELIVRLAAQGFYGDPHNGGNRDAVSWTMVGYRVLPEGVAWPAIDTTPPRTASWERIDDAYEVIVVGAGASGGVVACVLAEAGHRVLLVERGDWLDSDALRPDHLRNQRLPLGYDTPAGPPAAGNPRVLATAEGDRVLAPTDPRWSNNAMTLGGGTRVYGAMAFRFCPDDFRMATTYGVPEGSSLADWPISYDDLAPYYDRAEWEIGVSGDSAADPASPRARGYPMPPIRDNAALSRAALSRGATALGLTTGPVPLLINSEARGGRGACLSCGACVGFGCPGEFKNGTHNTVIPRALATGRCDVLTGARVERLLTDAGGRVTGVALATVAEGSIQRRTVAAAHVVLGAGAIETARLLLNSVSARESHGIGNNYDQVGRHLQGHVYAGAYGLFDEVVQDCRGPGPSIVTHDYRHHNDGLVGGGILANDFVLTPLGAWAALSRLGTIPPWVVVGKRAMRDLYARLALVMGPIQETPSPDARVTVDPTVCDAFGLPVARLSGGLHPASRAAAQFLSDKAVAWLQASGATTVLPFVGGAAEGPSGGQHQAGTCRMGTDPASSVTDAWGRVWGHDNLHIVDGSLHVTNGGVNPVLTILANAYRVSSHLAATLDTPGLGAEVERAATATSRRDNASTRATGEESCLAGRGAAVDWGVIEEPGVDDSTGTVDIRGVTGVGSVAAAGSMVEPLETRKVGSAGDAGRTGPRR